MEATLLDVLQDLDYDITHKRVLSRERRRSYLRVIRLFVKVIGNKKIKEYKATHAVHFHTYLRKSHLKPRTVHGYMTNMKCFAKRCFSNRVEFIKPVEFVIPTVPERLPVYMTQSELDTILAYTDEMIKPENLRPGIYAKVTMYCWRAAIRMFAKTAARSSEVLGLKFNEIDMHNCTASTIGK